jgi:hypothetical protein
MPGIYRPELSEGQRLGKAPEILSAFLRAKIGRKNGFMDIFIA